ncbi:MAG: LamG domain-containing protein [Phycisphaeraceae bacterium]
MPVRRHRLSLGSRRPYHLLGRRGSVGSAGNGGGGGGDDGGNGGGDGEPSYAATVMDLGPAAYWRLDDTGGAGSSVALDQTGDYDASYVNLASENYGQAGPLIGQASAAVELDGVDDHIDTGVASVGTGLFAGSGEAFSVTGFAKLTPGDGGTVIAKAEGSLALRVFQLFVQDGGPVVVLRGSDTAFAVNAADGAWHHYMITWDGSTATFTFDGQQQGAVSVGTAEDTPGQRILLGARSNGTAFFLRGLLSEWAIFDRMLSANERDLLWQRSGRA